jgi:cytochrome c-type biogenesis protein CcmH
MIGAWVLVAVIALVVLGTLLVPLRRRSAAPRRADFDLGVYRDQLGEVERDRERGLLTDDQAAAATVEIQRRILAVADDDGSSLATSHGLSRGVVVGAAIATPVAAVALYLVLGQPSLPDQPFAGRSQAGGVAGDPHSAAGSRGQQMEQLVGRLAERLLKQPNDVEGWVLLGRTYVTMNRLDDAVDAYRRALEISDNHPAVAADLGEVLITRAEGHIDIETLRLFKDALAADPRTVKARYYLGAAKVQDGDLKGAVDAWVDLIAVSPPNAPWVATVREQIGRAIEDLGIDPEILKPSPEALALGPPPATAPGAATTVAPGPDREDIEAARDMSVEERAEMIRTMVDRLADRLKENPNDRQGWLRLGRAYQVLGDEEKSRQAFARAEALGGGQPAPATTRPPGPSREDMKAAEEMSPEDRAQMIRGMVQRLADRLEKNPNDRQGWLRLGRAYEVLGETEKAGQAFDKAKALAE